MQLYDVIIIGAGAAGLTAALYTRRKNLSTLVLSVDVGGQTNLTSRIENYPGVDACNGIGLMQKFKQQVQDSGAGIRMGRVVAVDKDKEFIITLASGEKLLSKAVVLAFGKISRTLGVPGEDKFLGRGISTCVAIDGPRFKNRAVAVVGGGNAACEGAIELSSIASKVYLVHRKDSLRADEVTVNKLKALNVEFVLNSAVQEFIGDDRLEAVKVSSVGAQESRKLDVDGVFLEIGFVADTDFVRNLVEVNEKNEIVIDDRCNTSCSGVFACGDITTVPFKQTVISAGEGAKAGLEVYRFINGGRGVAIDWTH